jgi:hypothetical protein
MIVTPAILPYHQHARQSGRGEANENDMQFSGNMFYATPIDFYLENLYL